MTQAATVKISDWLSEIGSHELYPAAMLGELAPLGVWVEIVGGPEPEAILHHGDKVGHLFLQTVADTAAQIAGDPRGGEVTGDPRALLFAGYWLSAALARLLLNDSPGSRYHGRGFAFRADLAAIREAGF